MALFAGYVASVGRVRIGRVFFGHRRKLGISSAVTAQTRLSCGRRFRVLRMALGAVHPRFDMFIDQETVPSPGCRRRLREGAEQYDLRKAGQHAGQDDGNQGTAHRSADCCKEQVSIARPDGSSPPATAREDRIMSSSRCQIVARSDAPVRNDVD